MADHRVEIPIPGVYDISFNCYVVVTQCCESIAIKT